MSNLYLVTGGCGSLGRAVVKRLRAQGQNVRVFERRAPDKGEDGVEYVVGDLSDADAIDRAVQGTDVVIHCAAAMKGDWAEHKASTVDGTQNVVNACKKHRVKQLVHISSMSVINNAGTSIVDENAALEPRAEERGFYTRAKLEAERIVTDAARHGLPCVILRPGQIFGGGIPLITGAVARNVRGMWVVLGDGKLELPLVYIDDVVEAIAAAIEKKLSGGEIIQIVDPEHMTQQDVLELAGDHKRVVRVPRPLLFAVGRVSEIALRVVGKQSPLGVYRLKSALAPLHYESDRARQLLGWQPRVGIREGVRRVTAHS